MPRDQIRRYMDAGGSDEHHAAEPEPGGWQTRALEELEAAALSLRNGGILESVYARQQSLEVARMAGVDLRRTIQPVLGLGRPTPFEMTRMLVPARRRSVGLRSYLQGTLRSVGSSGPARHLTALPACVTTPPAGARGWDGTGNARCLPAE